MLPLHCTCPLTIDVAGKAEALRVCALPAPQHIVRGCSVHAKLVLIRLKQAVPLSNGGKLVVDKKLL